MLNNDCYSNSRFAEVSDYRCCRGNSWIAPTESNTSVLHLFEKRYILISPKAEQDLEDINARIASYNPQAANRLLDKILDKFETLASFPNMGKIRDELITNLRSFPVDDYLIFYFPIENGIEIARVASGYRDLEAMFEEEIDPR